MRKGATTLPSWAEEGTGIFHDLDQMVIEDCINMSMDTDVHEKISISSSIGKCEKARKELMTDIRRMLFSLGWTDQEPNLLPDNLNLSPEPLETRTPAQWKTAVATK